MDNTTREHARVTAKGILNDTLGLGTIYDAFGGEGVYAPADEYVTKRVLKLCTILMEFSELIGIR